MNLSIFSFDYLRDLQAAFRTMKTRAIVILCLFALILFLGMRMLWSFFFFENFQVMAVRSLSNETKAIGIGSSRMFYGVDPRAMPGSYVSLAANFLDMNGAERIWNKYSEQTPALRIVFIELSVSTLFYDMQVLAPQALQPLGLDISPEANDFLFRPDHALRLLLSPIFRWRFTPDFIESYNASLKDEDEQYAAVAGFIPSKMKLSQHQLFAERKVDQTRQHLEQFQSGVFERNLNAAKRMATDLEEKRIKVVFLRFPMDRHVWPVFERKWSESVSAAFLEIKSVAKEATFLDFSHNQDFPSDEFRDPDHLNSVGAMRFSALIAPIVRAELGL